MPPSQGKIPLHDHGLHDRTRESYYGINHVSKPGRAIGQPGVAQKRAPLSSLGGALGKSLGEAHWGQVSLFAKFMSRW